MLGYRSLKGPTRYCFLFESCFLSKKASEVAASIGVDLIGMVKTNTKGFCKATIEGLTKDWPGGSYMVLRSKPMVPAERPLLAIGYKYNSLKVLSFVAEEGEGNTTLGITYLSKYPDQFYNVLICPVARPLLVSKFFGLVNKVDSYNKSRQSDVTLEKLWVTQCGWIRLFTTIAMGTTITNSWKLFCYGVKTDRYNKFIGIREFLERIAVGCFNNPFTTDTGTPEKNIPSLDDIDNEGTIPTCWILNYSSSSTRNSEISLISDITIDTAPTTAIGHMAWKEFELEGEIYNRAARGYCHRRLPNGKRCLKRSLWYCNGFLIRFRRRNYYCKHNLRDCFASHHDSQVSLP